MAATERKPITKKRRFEIFKRDGFTCNYCGQKPPAVVLEVDHVIPVAEGGTNDKANLATSCFDCNRGKGADSLGVVPETLANRAALLQEREDQERAFARLLKQRQKRIDGAIDSIQDIMLADTDKVFSDRFRLSVKQFLESLSLDQVVFAAELATSRKADLDGRLSYFCGICWRLIKGDGRYARS